MLSVLPFTSIYSKFCMMRHGAFLPIWGGKTGLLSPNTEVIIIRDRGVQEAPDDLHVAECADTAFNKGILWGIHLYKSFLC